MNAQRFLTPAVRFRDALAFLTRLVPPRAACDAAALSACISCYAPVGLVLGLCLTLPSLAALHFLSSLPQAVPPLPAALAAWVWLAADMAVTRGLHWDGLADMGDATGSGAAGQRFWAILRDSRLGAFGALHLLLAFSGHWLVLAWHLGAGHWAAPLLAPAWGRACAVWLAAAAPPRNPASLGGMACAGASPALSRTYALAAALLLGGMAVCGVCAYPAAAVLALGQYVCIRRFAALARAHGGLSGDFLGAAVLWGQLWFLTVTV